MIKNLFLVDSDANGSLINNSIHIETLFQGIDAKQLNVQRISSRQALDGQWNAAGSAMLVVHSFKHWKDEFHYLLDKTKIPTFVIPTQFSHADFMKKEFSHPAISKIIVGTETYQKYFNRNLELDNKAKTIYLPTGDFRPVGPVSKHKERIIVVPALLHKEKNFELILRSARKLKSKYRSFKFAFILKKHPSVSDEEQKDVLTSIYDFISKNNLESHVRILLDVKPYDSYLRIADLIIIPQELNGDMYSGTLIDSIVANKPIITPNVPMAIDLCKKDAGIFLYEVINPKTGVTLDDDTIIQNLVDSCSILFDSKRIREIKEQQNAELCEEFSFAKISQQYVNLIKRYKN